MFTGRLRKLLKDVFVIGVAAFGIVAVPSQATADETVTVPTYRGSVEVAANPAKIVALDLAAIDMLDALGVPIVGAPQPHFVAALDAAVADAVKVGNLFEPDFEALARLAPDLIVAGGRSSTRVDSLARVAPTIDMTIWGKGHIDQSMSRLRALAEITGRQAEGAALENDFRAKLIEVAEAARDQGKALILMTSGPKISVYGAESRFGWLHQAIGLAEAAPGIDAQTHGEAVSFEFVGEVNPDWLLVVDRGAAIGAAGKSAKQTLNNQLIAETTAWTRGNIVYLNAADIYIAGGGIQSMTRVLDQLLTAFRSRP